MPPRSRNRAHGPANGRYVVETAGRNGWGTLAYADTRPAARKWAATATRNGLPARIIDTWGAHPTERYEP